MVGADRRPRPRRHRHRDGGARPREQLHQAPPAALQRPAARRQEPSLPEADAGRGVPAPATSCGGWREDGNAYGGPYIPAKPGTAHGVDGAPHLRHPLLQGDAQRPAAAALPAVPDQALPGAVRGGDLLAWTATARRPQDARLFLEGRTDEVVQTPARRRWRTRRPRTRASRRRRPCATRSAPSSAWRRRRRSPPPTSRSATSSGPTSRGSAAALQVFSVRDGKVVAREGYLARRVAEPERFLSSAIQQYYADGSATSRARCWSRPRSPTASCSRSGSSARRGTQVRIRVPQRGEKVRLLELVRAQRAPRLRPGVAASAHAVAGDPARAAGPPGPRGGAAPHRVLRHLEHPGLGHRGLDGGVRGRPAARSRTTGSSGSRGVGGSPDDFASMREVVGAALPPAARGGQGAARPRADRRRQGPARRGHGGAGRAGPRRPAGGQPGQARGADLRARPRRAGRAAARRRRCCSSCSACATRRTASPSASTARRARSARCARSWTTSPASGPIKRRKLLSRFGSLRGVRGASVEELTSAVGRTHGRADPRLGRPHALAAGHRRHLALEHDGSSYALPGLNDPSRHADTRRRRRRHHQHAGVAGRRRPRPRPSGGGRGRSRHGSRRPRPRAAHGRARPDRGGTQPRRRPGARAGVWPPPA